MFTQNTIERFVEKEKQNHNKRKRLYLHFDNRVAPTQKVIDYVTKPHNIMRHYFYPFLHNTIKVKRYKKDEGKTKIKSREIFYAAHLDAYIYSWYAEILSEHYEKQLETCGLDNNVLAYRKILIGSEGGNNIYYAKMVCDYIATQKDCVVMAFDISSFFDNLNHKLLKERLKEVMNISEIPEDLYKVLKSITKYSYVDRNEVFKQFGIKMYDKLLRRSYNRICDGKDFREKVRDLIKKNTNDFGIPQGSPISALLSNIYLLEFDKTIKSELSNIGGMYCRYSDDILVICDKTKKEHIEKLVAEEINRYRLNINPDKTEVIYYHTKDGVLRVDRSKSTKSKLQYLGYEFDGLRMEIRSSSISRYHRKMKQSIRRVYTKKIKRFHGTKIFVRGVYEKYSHLGTSNFITYAKKAFQITKSITIKRQLKPHMGKIKAELNKYRSK